MRPDEIIEEAIKLPLPDLERVASFLEFEVMDRLLENRN